MLCFVKKIFFHGYIVNSVSGTASCHCYEYNKSVILSVAKNLKAQILRYAQDDKLNLDEGRWYSFIVVRVRMVILNEVKNLDPSLTLLDDSSPPAVQRD